MLRQHERMTTSRYSVICLAMALCGLSCSRAGELPKSRVGEPSGIQTICLGRFLVEVPANVEVSSHPVGPRSAPGFQGIEDVAGYHAVKGVKWREITIDESFPSDASGYELTRLDAAEKLAEVRNTYKGALGDAQYWIKVRTDDLQKLKSPDDIRLARQRLEEDKRDASEFKRKLENSGEARLPGSASFAVRSGDEFSAGFLDPSDHRVRVFSGPLRQPEVQGVKVAADEYEAALRVFHRRNPTDIPSGPGYCTGHGFIDEPQNPELASLELSFRSLKYPNLLFTLFIWPAQPEKTSNIQNLPEMGIQQGTFVGLAGATHTIGPKTTAIAGMPARWFAAAQKAGCSQGKCWGEGAAYDIEAQTFGEAGRADRPRMTLLMKAAMPTDRRPSLAGREPPPFKEGQSIFDQVLQSIRLRPGAIAGRP